MSLSVLENREKMDITMYPVASEEQYADGQIIFREGSWGDWVYVIKHGSVEISKTIGEKPMSYRSLSRVRFSVSSGIWACLNELPRLGHVGRQPSASLIAPS
jgi:hypothetical protein